MDRSRQRRGRKLRGRVTLVTSLYAVRRPGCYGPQLPPTVAQLWTLAPSPVTYDGRPCRWTLYIRKIMFELNTLLVPIDFSPTSRTAFERACKMVTGANPVIIVHHVIDLWLSRSVASLEMGTRDDVIATMRTRGAAALAQLEQAPPEGIEVQSIISEGVPFLEIIRKAEEFQVDAVVMGKFGQRGQLEGLLLGTTADRVTRGCTRPVIVLPI